MMNQQMISEIQKKQKSSSEPGMVLQRKCDRCDEKKKRDMDNRILHRSATGTGPEVVPPVVHDVLISPGQPLDSGTRGFMEPRFGYDFSAVRIHTGKAAEESADAVNARAYTVGHNIAFGKGEYNPASHGGRALLAHELVHTIQQTRSSQGKNPDQSAGDVSKKVVNGESVSSDQIPGISPGLYLAEKEGSNAVTDFSKCDPKMSIDLYEKHRAAIGYVNRAISSLSKGWKSMNEVNKGYFRQYFDPSQSGDIDESFIRDVHENFLRIRRVLNSVRFDCDSGYISGKMCVGGRLMWTMWGDTHVCPAYKSSSDDKFKIETIIHESTHKALKTTDREYSNEPGFQKLKPRGSGLLSFLSSIPIIGFIFKVLGGTNDTLNNPDSYSGYAMQME